ncbi:tRNA lysidine(34) synthetase TilS (plasmid) [Pedobacter sp. BS3]|uniref:tRNA lysidine(34) synthetase TilS n=1 Tax=Pedobacter sp. BS3 TaxID=2567937 RepID=UPI0011EE7CA0|nr:tRNA lysidine(34) synthetase TilS [Pedobacter sp. BS3]TZF85831.1 tRNA lysidine(34) synthetase TilS [Pedobacter sp. BS3]
MLPLQAFKQFINQHHLFLDNDRILLAVSGGKDSVLMAYLFNAASYKFGIAHCNFKLRGKDADDDEKFVAALADTFDVPFYSTAFNTETYAKINRISIQMAARELRYNWLESVRKENGYSYLALAHHQNDVIETVLLNLTRGTGIAGLHGIFPKRDIKIRPLLFIGRDEIDAIIESEKISYREDSSNASVKYARNKIRHLVVPVLKQLNPQLEQTFEENVRRLTDAEAFISAEIEKLRSQLFIETGEDSFRIAISELNVLKPLHFTLFELFKPFGFSEAVINDLIRSLPGQAGKIFESPTHFILLDRGKLLLQKRAEALPESVNIIENDTHVHWHNLQITMDAKDAEEVTIIPSPDRLYVDAGLLQYPLTVRSWLQGDRLRPFGMKSGMKKLSDVFTGAKIPLTEKLLYPVLVNGNSDIIGIPGLKADDRYKVMPHTKKVTIFEVQKQTSAW